MHEAIQDAMDIAMAKIRAKVLDIWNDKYLELTFEAGCGWPLY